MTKWFFIVHSFLQNLTAMCYLTEINKSLGNKVAEQMVEPFSTKASCDWWKYPDSDLCTGFQPPTRRVNGTQCTSYGDTWWKKNTTDSHLSLLIWENDPQRCLLLKCMLQAQRGWGHCKNAVQRLMSGFFWFRGLMSVSVSILVRSFCWGTGCL